ncbi:hypothetical protein [Geothermobacter hydrogeniphilus]|uniref:hypothetical protein n=1 Tax=Geothermobacter hydrogeniphilus TaxID=1969733 RepID=UPI0011AF0B2E|nr:hypothetical protein [Geothermobacter hydrogeniphilus]
MDDITDGNLLKKNDPAFSSPIIRIDAFARKSKWGRPSKKRHQQGARLSSNEACLRTLKQ